MSEWENRFEVDVLFFHVSYVSVVVQCFVFVSVLVTLRVSTNVFVLLYSE